MANFSALNTVYNFYMTTYAPKTNSRYDTHKKSELRSVYNSIVDQNKDAPLYLLHNSKSTQEFAVSVKENARTLKNTISSLGSFNSDGVLDKKSASSTDESIATVTYNNDSDEAAPVQGFDMTVSSLAKPQTNVGNYLTSDAQASISPDTYSFDIGINSLSYEFQFSVHSGDTNEDLLQRLGRLINNAKIGLNAEVIDNPDDQTQTALKLESSTTGKHDSEGLLFTISEDHTSKNTGTVDYLGINTVTSLASDAKFSINGTDHTSESNSFTVANAFDVTLHNTTDQENESIVSIGLKTDVDSLAENIGSLVNGYNSFLRAASEYTDSQPKSNDIVNDFSGISRTFAKGLTDVGVNLNLDGTLELNEDTFRKKIQNGDIDQSLTPVKSFTNALLNKSNQISLNPMRYVDKTVVEYKNPGKNFANPYITSEYSGMLFNSYC